MYLNDILTGTLSKTGSAAHVEKQGAGKVMGGHVIPRY